MPVNQKSFILVIIMVCLAFPLVAQSGNFKIRNQEMPLPLSVTFRSTDPTQEMFRGSWTQGHNSFQHVWDERFASFHYNSMGWFCKTEWKLEQKTGIPLRFRLGSYSAAARLEGKL